jgi:hypothetical protein
MNEWAARNRWIAPEVWMSEIPSFLSEAFHQAIVVCYNWSGDDREAPAVGVAWDPNREPDPQHPEALCGVVSRYTDEMPSPVVDSLQKLPYNVSDSVGVDRTYANGARCLIDFIKLKREMFNRSR